MENITIEKIIKFNSVIDSIESVNVNDELRYKVLEDNAHANGTIGLSGTVNTLEGKKQFNEDVEIDIYAPFEKQIDKDTFKLKVKDYSYMVNNKSLIIYLILSMEGIVDFKEEKKESESIIDEINTLNEINEEEMVREEIIEPVKIIEEVKDVKEDNVKIIETKENISSSWANDMFNLKDNYVIFHKFKLK